VSLKKRRNIYIVAEAGVNHNGSLARALRMVETAAKSGADAVKFQTFVPEEVISRHAPMAAYQKKNAAHETSQLEMVRKLALDEVAHHKLVNHAARCGIDFLSTPFDLPSVDFLVKGLGLKTIKVPSGEITNAPMLYRIGRLAKRIILSTGMADLDEIDAALGYIVAGFERRDPLRYGRGYTKSRLSPASRAWVRTNVAILHCTTEYPAPMAELNLNVMASLREHFQTSVGFSDHSLGISAAAAAAALGADIIEKHFTLDRSLPGPDHKASLMPHELSDLIRQVRDIEAALGSSCKVATPSERKNMPIARKSLVARCAIAAGELFTENNLGIKRPGNGVSPTQYWAYLGAKAPRSYAEDELIAPISGRGISSRKRGR